MDPRKQLVTIPLAIGMDNVTFDEVVRPNGDRPRLTESRNTRLSKVPGLVSKAPGATRILNDSTIAGPVGGLIPAADRDSTLLPLSVGQISKRVHGSNVDLQRAPFPKNVAPFASNDDAHQMDSYFPVEVESSGCLPGGRTRLNVAACYDSIAQVTYYFAGDAGGTGIYVTAVSDDGRVHTPWQFAGVLCDATETGFLGASAHGSTIVLWTQSGYVSPAIVAYKLTFSAVGALTAMSAATTIYTPLTKNSKLAALAYDPDDTSTAYLVCQDSAVANSITISKVTISTLATATATIAVGGAFDQVSIAYLFNMNGSNYLSVAVSRTAGSSNFYTINPTTLATLTTTAAVLFQGITSCGFFYDIQIGGVFPVFAVSQTMGATPGANNTYVYMAAYSAFTIPLRSLRMVGPIVTHKASSTKCVPYFTCINQWANTGSYDPTSANFVAEPAVEVYRFSYQSLYGLSCVARLGTDRVIRYPGSSVTGDYTITTSSNCLAVGDRMLVSYLAENVEEGVTATGYRPRYAWLSLASRQPQIAYEADGAAIIAGALPATWDGFAINEFSPQRAPVIAGTVTAAAGTLNGNHLFAAVITWKDAQGLLHRSAPSNVIALTGANFRANLTIYVPHSYIGGPTGSSTGNYGMSVTLYVSEASGLVLYAQIPTAFLSPSVNSYTTTFAAEPTVDSVHPAIYTDGSATQELPSFCPNASKSVAVIQDRVWMLDAEERGRGYFSKPKVRGFFPQMNPDCKVDFPASAGNLRSVIGFNDAPIFLGDAGLWTVAGEGPDALLTPPDFAAPQQISDVPCTQRNSVVRSPAGVFFVSNNRFAKFDGAVSILHDVDASLYGNIVGTAVFSKYHEVCFFTAQGYVWVYNWEAGAFTVWDTTVTGVTSLTGCAQVPTSGKVLYYGDTGELWLMDPDTVSTTAQISLKTGWIVVSGAQEMNMLGDLVLHAKRSSAHALSVVVATDYDETTTENTDTKSWDATEVLNSMTDSVTSKRYDLVPEVKNKHTRALRLTIAESGSSGESFQPSSISIEAIKTERKAERSYPQSARK